MSKVFKAGWYQAASGELPESLSTSRSTVKLVVNSESYLTQHLGHIFIRLESIATATTLSWCLTRDLDGDEALTPPEAYDFSEVKNDVFGGTATRCSIIRKICLTLPKVFEGEGDLKEIYLQLKLDAGTATVAEVIIQTEVE